MSSRRLSLRELNFILIRKVDCGEFSLYMPM